MKVRTRIAPSPTGELHIGTLRTVLYNYALAKQQNGQFIIRIEDTDQNRLVEGSQQRIIQTIYNYQITWDEGPDISGPYGPYIQSQRLNIYKKYVNKLINKHKAYYCFCSKERLQKLRKTQKAKKQIPKYDQHCLKLSTKEIKQKLSNKTPCVIRQKLPTNQIIKFNDLIMGEIKINTKELDDTILLKTDGYPTYHLAVVIDDHLMKISHVIRGSEWISSTPKHILLYQAFEWSTPKFAHQPVILSPTGKGKMSKREGDVSAQSFLNKGYLPEAILNFLMLLSWSPKNDREFFTLKEFIQAFKFKDINASNPKFDHNKLNYFNMHYIKNLTDKELANRLNKFAPDNATNQQLLALAPLVKERIKTLNEFTEMTKFIFSNITLPESGWKKLTTEHLNAALKIIKNTTTDNWNAEHLTGKFLSIIESNHWKTGHFFMNLRLAISGQKITPPITESIIILGKTTTLTRLNFALSNLSPQSP